MVLTAIFHRPMISRTELAGLTGLNASAVTKILQDLLEQRFVEEVEADPASASTGPGRKRVRLRVCEDAVCVLALEINTSEAHFVAVDLHGNQLYSNRQPFHRPERIDDRALVELDRFREHRPDLYARATLLMISVGGIIDSDQGTILVSGYHRIRNQPIVATLKNKHRFPIYLENDANAEALGEWSLLARDSSRLTMVYLTAKIPEDAIYPISLGGGIILQGEVWRGAKCSSGEFSSAYHEHLADLSAAAAGKLGWNDPYQGSVMRRLLTECSVQELRGMPSVFEMIDSVGLMLSHLVSFVDPDHVVVSVSPIEYRPVLLEMLDERFGANCIIEGQKRLLLTPPKLGGDAAIKGLITLGLEKVFPRRSAKVSALFRD